MLVVLMGVLRDGDQKQLPAPAAAKRIFSAMFSPVVMLLLGGFTIAAALSKHDVARMMASRVLANAAENSKKLLLACIFVATFLSMWISNVAAPVLCYSLIQVSFPHFSSNKLTRCCSQFYEHFLVNPLMRGV